jgi:hypothetical protein
MILPVPWTASAARLKRRARVIPAMITPFRRAVSRLYCRFRGPHCSRCCVLFSQRYALKVPALPRGGVVHVVVPSVPPRAADPVRPVLRRGQACRISPLSGGPDGRDRHPRRAAGHDGRDGHLPRLLVQDGMLIDGYDRTRVASEPGWTELPAMDRGEGSGDISGAGMPRRESHAVPTCITCIRLDLSQVGGGRDLNPRTAHCQ